MLRIPQVEGNWPRKLQINSTRTPHVGSEIRTDHPQNTSLELYRCANLLDASAVKRTATHTNERTQCCMLSETLQNHLNTAVIWNNCYAHDHGSISWSWSYITTDSQSASLSWCQALIWDMWPIFFRHEISCRQLRLCYFVAPSLTRGRVCNLLYNCFWALPEQSL
jgi:hypothetical protein